MDHPLHDREEFSAGGLCFRAIHVRGHSEDSFAFYAEVGEQRWIFTGDIVFYGGVLGVINASGSGMDGYRADLEKLRDLSIDGLFPGHGLFTFQGGQRHINCALEQIKKGFLCRQIGQGDIIF